MWKDIKYLIAYIAPIAAFAGVYLGGGWSLGSVYIGFVFIPIVELALPGTSKNLSPEAELSQNKRRFFDFLLYLNIPILYGLLFYFFHTIQTRELSNFELAGMICNVGLIIGISGINVGHELGHRSNQYEQFMAKILLLPALYLHFNIEHNRGHHKHVATEEDPASARLGESLYAFWFRSVLGGYLNAWKLEKKRLKKIGKPNFSWANEMIRFQVFQVTYLILLGFLFGWAMIPFALAAAVFGFLMLECVNYIEHYGLRRQKLPSGRYEPVRPSHSWNSNHELGRIFLYELTRHSDHHYKASRKYQILRHHEESPQLPHGYPASILLSLVPPLWFWHMNRRVKKVKM